MLLNAPTAHLYTPSLHTHTHTRARADLMKQSPELMTRALNLHNAIIRKARWANFGYTVEQEGDSYVLVFYEALDAVIFCLQVGVGRGGGGPWVGGWDGRWEGGREGGWVGG